MTHNRVLIMEAGLAGLALARALDEAGLARRRPNAKPASPGCCRGCWLPTIAG